MTPARKQPPLPDDLPELFVDLVARVDRLEAWIHELRSERMRPPVRRPNWEDFEALRRQVEDLRTRCDQPG